MSGAIAGTSNRATADARPAQTTRRTANAQGLTPDQQAAVRELQARDRAVRAHEAAHKAVGGALAGGVSLSYQNGPDGRQYAVGGEVPISLTTDRDPRTTVRTMRQVIAAALAPADPSAQDRAVAAQARAIQAEAERQAAAAPAADGAAGADATAEAKPSDPRLAAYRQGPSGPGALLSLVA